MHATRDRAERRSPAGSGRLRALAMCEVAAFVAVAQHGGFTSAARALHLSQPGVSARVKRLEDALGVLLVDRSARRLTLTAEGAAFLPRALAALEALDAAYLAARGCGPTTMADHPCRPPGGH